MKAQDFRHQVREVPDRACVFSQAMVFVVETSVVKPIANHIVANQRVIDDAE